jgi:hypothetical protein
MKELEKYTMALVAVIGFLILVATMRDCYVAREISNCAQFGDSTVAECAEAIRERD